MRRFALLGLCLCLLAAVLTGCTEKEKPADQIIVAEVNGTTITKAEAQSMYDVAMASMSAMYSQYGYAFDASNAEISAEAKAEVLNMLVEQRVLELKLDELGLSLTEEEMATLEENAKTQFEALKQSYMTSMGATEEETVAAIAEYGYTPEMILYYAKADAVNKRLRNVTDETIEITEDDIQTEYTARIDAAKESYAADPDAFPNDALSGATLYYYPAGYRQIKIISIPITGETGDQISELQDQIYTASYYEWMYSSSLESEDINEATRETYQGLADRYHADVESLTGQLQELQDKGLEEILATAQEALEKATAEGADFDQLTAEYLAGAEAPTFPGGFPFREDCTVFDSAVLEAAMSLEAVGDISDLVGTVGGYHILLYAGDLAEREVPLEEVRETVTANVTSAKSEAAYTEAVSKWVSEAEIKTYASKF